MTKDGGGLSSQGQFALLLHSTVFSLLEFRSYGTSFNGGHETVAAAYKLKGAHLSAPLGMRETVGVYDCS
jgi:hypothetical protein